MPHLLYEKRDGIAYVTLNRPDKRNAMDPEMVVQLADAWTDVQNDPEIRVALLTSAGQQSFCAGADLGRLLPLMTRAREPEDEWDRKFVANRKMMNAALMRTNDMYTPVVAAIQGPALAGGMEILLNVDIRIASTRATFGLTEVRRGIIPGGGSLARLGRQIGHAAVMEIVLGGEPISAEEAYRIGFVNRVVEPEALSETALAWAHKIAKGGPLALRKAKEALVRSTGENLESAFGIEEDCIRVIFRSEDAKEGPRAFMERREPRFTGR